MPARTIYLIKRVETEVTAQMIKRLSAYGITPAQFVVMSFVNDHPDDLSSAQLSRRFLMTPQSMNETIKALEKKGLLLKNTDPGHRRILRISLTELGKEQLSRCNQSMDELEAAFFQSLAPEEMDAFRELLGKILKKTNDEHL